MATACGPSPVNQPGPYVADAGTISDAGTTSDAGTPPTCESQIPFDQAITIDSESITQIHGAAVFANDSLWITYNRPRPDHLFDVYVTQIACDGSTKLEPLRVSTSTARNDVEPQILALDDRLVIAWSSDNQTGINNLDIWYRLYNLDGSPMGDETLLQMTRNGIEEPGNAWMPKLAKHGDGFVIAGSWGHSATNRFAVFVQRLSRDGQLLGETMDAVLEPETSQLWPSVATDADGALRLAWTRSPDNNKGMVDLVYTTRIVANSTIAETPQLVIAAPSSGGNLSKDGSLISFSRTNVSGSTVFIAQTNALDQRVATGRAGKRDYAPYLAGDALVYYRNISGFRNDVVFSRFSRNPLLIDNSEILTTEPAAPYSPIFTVVPGGYFVGWSQGMNPDFRLIGRFIRK
jgi:hypothetical protein